MFTFVKWAVVRRARLHVYSGRPLTDVHAATTFREHFSSLADAIAQPDLPNKLASELYSKSLVSRALRDAVHYTRGLSG